LHQITKLTFGETQKPIYWQPGWFFCDHSRTTEVVSASKILQERFLTAHLLGCWLRLATSDREKKILGWLKKQWFYSKICGVRTKHV